MHKENSPQSQKDSCTKYLAWQSPPLLNKKPKPIIKPNLGTGNLSPSQEKNLHQLSRLKLSTGSSFPYQTETCTMPATFYPAYSWHKGTLPFPRGKKP